MELSQQEVEDILDVFSDILEVYADEIQHGTHGDTALEKAEYEEPRVLPGRPDKECVICHECAHVLCEKVPWLGHLIMPESSHAHHYKDHERLKAEGHLGWDLREDND